MTAYDALSTSGQALFRRLRDQASVTRPSNEIPDTLWGLGYVRQDGALYEIRKADTGRNIVKTHLSVERIDASDVPASNSIAFENLTADARSAFEAALSEGTHTRRGERLPEQLRTNRIVQYRSDAYRLRVRVGDVRVW